MKKDMRGQYKNRPFSNAEDIYINDNWGKMRIVDIGAHLKRPAASISNRAGLLSLDRIKR